MTHPSTASTADTRFDDHRFVRTLLYARQDPGSRRRLQSADSTATAFRAYPLLAPWWLDHRKLKEPVLFFAATMARHPRLHQAERAPVFGRLTYLLTRPPASVIRHPSAETRMLALQRQSLASAHRSINAVLSMADSSPLHQLNWFALWLTYRYWSKPTRSGSVAEGRYPARHRVLEAFYTPIAAQQPDPTADSE